MKEDTQTSADLAKLGDLIDGIEVAMLTTRASDNSMVSRPLQTLKLDTNGDLVFFTAMNSHKVDELRANPSVNLAYSNPHKQCYVSVRGEARIDRDRSTIEELWSPVQRVFFPDGKDDPNLAVLRIHVRDAAYWESSGNFVGRALDFARAVLSDRPADLGEHGKLSGS